MDLKDSLEGELLAIVQELGTFSGDNGTIQHGDRTIDSARKILQCLSKDDPKERPLHFQLGCWKVVQNYFIPLLNEYYEDDALAMLILRNLVRITLPLPKQVSNLEEAISHLQHYKDAIIDSNVMTILFSYLTPALEANDLSKENRALDWMELLIAFLNNLLAIPDVAFVQDTSKMALSDLQDRFICKIASEQIFSLLSILSSFIITNKLEFLYLPIIESIYLLLVRETPEMLRTPSNQQERLRSLLQKEKKGKHSLLFGMSTRHSRFGGAFAKSSQVGMHSTKVISSNALLTSSQETPKFEPSTVTRHRQRYLNDSVRITLDAFALNFLSSLDAAELIYAVFKLLEREGVQALSDDYLHFFFLQAIFLELHRDRMRPVGDYSHRAIVGLLYQEDICKYNLRLLDEFCCDNNTQNMEVCLYWLNEFLHLIVWLLESSDVEDKSNAKVLIANIFAVEERMRLLPDLLISYNPKLFSTQHLINLVEANSLTLQIFEGCHGKLSVEKHRPRIDSSCRNGKRDESESKSVDALQDENLSELEEFKKLTRPADLSSEDDAIDDYSNYIGKQWEADDFMRRLISGKVVSNTIHFLLAFDHTPSLTLRVVDLYIRMISPQFQQIGIFFQLSFFLKFEQIMSVRETSQKEVYLRVLEFVKLVIREFFHIFEKDKNMLLELLFWKSKSHSYDIGRIPEARNHGNRARERKLSSKSERSEASKEFQISTNFTDSEDDPIEENNPLSTILERFSLDSSSRCILSALESFLQKCLNFRLNTFSPEDFSSTVAALSEYEFPAILSEVFDEIGILRSNSECTVPRLVSPDKIHSSLEIIGSRLATSTACCNLRAIRFHQEAHIVLQLCIHIVILFCLVLCLMEKAYSLSVEEACAALRVDVKKGLSTHEVEGRRRQWGLNTLPAADATPFWKLILKQFQDQLVIILLIAAVVSLLLALFEGSDGEAKNSWAAFVEPGVILVILVLNAVVGVVQETNAEKSIEKLKEMEAVHAVVLRDGELKQIDCAELVPGDIVHVGTGDKVPADLRVCEIISSVLTSDESSLTGESIGVNKSTDTIFDSSVVDQDKKNMLFSSTLITRGKAIGLVVLTGSHTSVGKIQKILNEDVEIKTPLQQNLDHFGEQLSKIIMGICILVWVINIGNFSSPEHGGFIGGAVYYFKIAVALAVAAIPEGLPAVVTTCLALGTIRMARKNAIVRSLPSVETLGCTSVICSDKTGTLTTNKMTVRSILVLDSEGECENFSVSGNNWSPYGEVFSKPSDLSISHPGGVPSLALVSKICSLCNDASLAYSDISESDEGFVKIGDPTEAALKVLAEKLGVPDNRSWVSISQLKKEERVIAVSNYWHSTCQKLTTLEFTRNRKSMSVLVNEKGKNRLLVKGAPELLIPRCTRAFRGLGKIETFNEELRIKVLSGCNNFTSSGLRCLALAYREADDVSVNDARLKSTDTFLEVESNLIFVGIVGMLDPPRVGLHSAIDTCSSAGIKVIMVTGDNKDTAVTIAREIGIFSPGESIERKAIIGSDFQNLSEMDQRHLLHDIKVFARVEPSHKQLLVRLLQDEGEIVAMTGDGVNDAPALKRADIGVAMGSGTAVARESADMVLQDDNFLTIVSAIEQGRTIYANTKQFIRYLISSNIGEVACIFFTTLLGIPDVLHPVQLLWVNLVTDGLPATALGFNKPDCDVMRNPPRPKFERIINGWLIVRYMVIGIYVGVATILGFVWWHLWSPEGPRISFYQLRNFHDCMPNEQAWVGIDCNVFKDYRASTIGLSILVTIEMLNALNALSENQSLLTIPPWANPFVLISICLSFLLHFFILYVPSFASIFGVSPIGLNDWIVVFLFSIPIILIDEILKAISRHQTARWGDDIWSNCGSYLKYRLGFVSRKGYRRNSFQEVEP